MLHFDSVLQLYLIFSSASPRRSGPSRSSATSSAGEAFAPREENGISQSGASQVVHQLERRLGVKLIDRSKRPFVLTPEGETYYEGCRKLVQRYDALEDQVRTLHEEVSGRVRVVSIYSVGLHHMSRYLQEFLSQYPKANVRLEYQHPHRVYEAVEKDHADLGLVSYPRSSRTIEAIGWREETMVLVCATHRLARQR